MLLELEPVWTQLEETYDALKAVLDEVPDDRLEWRPAEKAMTASEIAQHVVRANITYTNVMEAGERGVRPGYQQNLGRAELMERVQMSLDHVHQTFDSLPIDRLHAPCADDWEPMGLLIPGPLDALWFALQILRHTAYHVGQVNIISLMIESDT